MFANVDYSHPEVIKDVMNWCVWVVKELGLKGFRFDACQHFSQRFTNELVQKLEETYGKEELFLVGEFWVPGVKEMLEWLDGMNHTYSLYDSPLVWNFSSLSTARDGDLRKVFDGSLVKERPENAVVSHKDLRLACEVANIVPDCGNEPRYPTWSNRGNKNRSVLQASGIFSYPSTTGGVPLRFLW